MSFPVLLVIAYFVGSLPIGLIVGRLAAGIDVREHGSGNIGATNVWRTLTEKCGRFWGNLYGAIVWTADVCKGLLPVLAAYPYLAHNSWATVLAGICSILGHNFSPFLRFKGGKGVATSLGVAFGLSWQAGVIGFGLWFVVLAATRYISVASIVGTAAGALSIWLFNHEGLPYGVFGALATVFVVVKHRPNMKRLRAGTEPKIGERKPASGASTSDGPVSAS